METKRFSKNDEGFVCGHCGREVEPLGYTSRDHCPHCLWSCHADELPGDRSSECQGLMEPVSARPDPKKGYVIIYRCTKCGEIRKCKAALGATSQPDDIRLIISLTAKPFIEK